MHLWFYLTEHNNFKGVFIVIQLKITEKTLFSTPLHCTQIQSLFLSFARRIGMLSFRVRQL